MLLEKRFIQSCSTQADSKLGKEYIKDVYCHPAYLTYMLSESESEVVQSCPTFCNPMGCRLPGSSVRGIFQARILKWFAFSSFRGSSQPRGSNPGLLNCRQTLYRLSHQGSLDAESITQNARLDKAQAGVKNAGKNIKNLRYADDTTFMAECEQESRHQDDASTSQEIPKIVANHWELGERQRTNFPALGGTKLAKTSSSDWQTLEL